MVSLALACSQGEGEAGASSAAAATERPARDGARQEGDRPGGGGTRRAPTVALAASDVATVERGTLEESTPITGDLHPIERVEVRARLEGDIVGVFVREGERVREGQLLARFESSEQESDRASAEAERTAAEAELATAEWNLEQADELFKAGAIPERDLRTAQQAVAAARARLAAAQARVRSTSSFVRDTRVLAPTSGVVAERVVENGERVARGATMFTLVRNDVLELAAAVPARQATGVVAGQTVRFAAGGREFSGKVARVSPTIDPATRAVTVYVQVANPKGELKGGTLATGRVVGRTVRDALVVPAAGLRQGAGNDRPFVYRIQGNTLDVAPVEVGVVDERAGMAEVRAGLEEGDRVVVGNVGTLGRGMQVEVLGSEVTQPARR